MGSRNKFEIVLTQEVAFKDCSDRYHLLQLGSATILNLNTGRGADATQYTVKWIHDSIVELSRLDREMKPAAILQMAYVMTMTHSFVNCPETLINEKERFQMISIELRKQVRFVEWIRFKRGDQFHFRYFGPARVNP